MECRNRTSDLQQSALTVAKDKPLQCIPSDARVHPTNKKTWPNSSSHIMRSCWAFPSISQLLDAFHYTLVSRNSRTNRSRAQFGYSIPPKQISRVHLIFDIVKAVVVAIADDAITHIFELS